MTITDQTTLAELQRIGRDLGLSTIQLDRDKDGILATLVLRGERPTVGRGTTIAAAIEDAIGKLRAARAS